MAGAIGRTKGGRLPAPRDLDELRGRAEELSGRTLSEIAGALGFRVDGAGVRTKGKVGELFERVLGATGGAQAVVDFPALGVELKTVPVDVRGVPIESTFVCAFAVGEADRAEWASSWARRKLARVLWVPVVDEGDARRVGVPLLWSPSDGQEATLRADFDELMGTIGAGGIEGLTARDGRWLQVRPKAAHGRVRTLAFGAGGEPIATVPRGLYLRARFTGALLRDPLAEP